MYRFLSFLFIFFTLHSAFAQTKAGDPPPITFKGKITFERKVNTHKQMEDMMKGNAQASGMLDMMKKQMPKYKTDIFELSFNERYTLYKPAPNGITESKMMMGNAPADRNTVFSDFESDSSVSEKKIFEKTYLIRDTLKKFEWKITEEFRKIAGFNCRRAETVIMDSLYVIAFYADGIMTPGGPEAFNGLPGMILGVVMPRLNLTWFATNIENYLPDEKGMTPPVKGDKTTYAQISTSLAESTKQWGPFAQRILWYVFL